MTMPTRAPNPETLEKPRRHHHPAKFKLEILDLTDQAGPGRPELLRKHGLYSSHLTSWRRARELGTLGPLAKKRRPKADPKQAELLLDLDSGQVTRGSRAARWPAGLARHALASLRSARPGGPWLLGGHSFGAWIALEMVRTLEAAGASVAGLVVLDMPAPALGPAGTPEDPTRLRRTLLDIVEGTYGLRLDIPPDELHGEAWMHTLSAALERAGAATGGLDSVVRMMHVLGADERALAERTRAGAPIAAPILLLRTAAPVPGSTPACASDGTWGWAEVGRRPVVVRHLDGDHASLLAANHAQTTAAALRAWLSELPPFPTNTP